jgi:hypothetical protein
VLRRYRLKAHLVNIGGVRGWKLTGCIGGTYVFDEHHDSASQQRKGVKGTVVPTTTPATPAANTAPAPAKPTT